MPSLKWGTLFDNSIGSLNIYDLISNVFTVTNVFGIACNSTIPVFIAVFTAWAIHTLGMLTNPTPNTNAGNAIRMQWFQAAFWIAIIISAISTGRIYLSRPPQAEWGGREWAIVIIVIMNIVYSATKTDFFVRNLSESTNKPLYPIGIQYLDIILMVLALCIAAMPAIIPDVPNILVVVGVSILFMLVFYFFYLCGLSAPTLMFTLCIIFSVIAIHAICYKKKEEVDFTSIYFLTSIVFFCFYTLSITQIQATVPVAALLYSFLFSIIPAYILKYSQNTDMGFNMLVSTATSWAIYLILWGANNKKHKPWMIIQALYIGTLVGCSAAAWTGGVAENLSDYLQDIDIKSYGIDLDAFKRPSPIGEYGEKIMPKIWKILFLSFIVIKTKYVMPWGWNEIFTLGNVKYPKKYRWDFIKKWP